MATKWVTVQVDSELLQAVQDAISKRWGWTGMGVAVSGRAQTVRVALTAALDLVEGRLVRASDEITEIDRCQVCGVAIGVVDYDGNDPSKGPGFEEWKQAMQRKWRWHQPCPNTPKGDARE